MATQAPNSFKDPYWQDLSGRVEAKLELPKGLLGAIVTRGERSNADQVSSAGAKSPFQIIPATRNAAIKKYGIDPYLSAGNAAEVAGLLLKDSLDRNNGDVKLAVAEYHGGTNRANWGPITKAYVQRVTGSAPVFTDLPKAVTPGQSTFDRTMAATAPDTSGSIANVLQAYQSGQMSPEDAADFEREVKTGKIQLPRGATLNAAGGAGAAPAAGLDGVIAAYRAGTMSPEDKADFEKLVDSGAVKLPATADQIPGAGGDAAPAATEAIPSNAPTSIGDKVIGAGEAGLQALTGATTGQIGLIANTIGGVAGQVLNGTLGTQAGANATEQSAIGGMNALTYQPRTPSGQAQAAALGSAMQQALPVLPLAGEMAALGRGAAPVAQAARDAAPVVVGAAKAGASLMAELPGNISAKARQALGFETAEAKPTPGTMASGGAAGTDIAAQRTALAEGLPIPIKLTKGQASRDFEQTRFERETAKDPSAGAPIRERLDDQNAALPQNFEAMIDETGARAPNLIETGRTVVDDGLVKAAARAKNEYRIKYKEAEKAGDMEAPVSTEPIVNFLLENESFDSPTLAPSLGLARKELLRLGGAEMVDGELQPRDLPLRQAEVLRRQINHSIGADPTNGTNMKFGVDLKNIIDTATDGLGGDLYKEARAARTRYAQLYENNSIVSDLLRKRRGTGDRQVALEDVFRKTILNGTRQGLTDLRRTLQVGGGPEGAQAWRELQGATVRHLLDEATKGVGRDSRGNAIFSASKLHNAIRALDQDGKLGFILTKRGAQQIRDINELAKVIYTVPPGTVNTSNTASVVLAALAEAGATGALTGLPVPVLSGLKLLANQIKDRKVRARINDALNNPTGGR